MTHMKKKCRQLQESRLLIHLWERGKFYIITVTPLSGCIWEMLLGFPTQWASLRFLSELHWFWIISSFLSRTHWGAWICARRSLHHLHCGASAFLFHPRQPHVSSTSIKQTRSNCDLCEPRCDLGSFLTNLFIRHFKFRASFEGRTIFSRKKKKAE